MADFSYSDDPELQALNNAVLADPDEFENWEKLVRAAETQEDGNTLNRNSSPQAIAATRNVYDSFLGRFPLFFGYWKKYADLEFSIAGPEAAEMVYERGVASVPTSVDMWQNYCGFKSETNHDLDQIRELFERGAESCGLDFMSHPFWDKYLEFEGRLAPDDRSFGILSRLIHIPLYQYARYFERFRAACANRPATELAPPEIFQRLEAQASSQSRPKGENPADAERELRVLLEENHMSIFNRTQTETTKRWQYEQEIKRPYFHVTELDEPQLENWRKYLDFEDANGGYERTKFLYERCLVTAANYDEFWTRYALWMASQPQKRPEEVRNIYQRASCIFVPIAKPAIRLLWANFEETAGRADVAADILEAIILVLPNHLEAIMALVHLHRRREGKDAALQTLRKYVDNSEVTSAVRGALVAESARMVYSQSEDATAARKIFAAAQGSNLGNRAFWMKWFFFEAQLPIAGKPDEHYQRVKAVYDAVRQKSRLVADTIADLTTYYQAYLQEYGPKDAMEEYMQLEREIKGPTTAGLSGKQMPGLENGLAGAATNESAKANGGGAYDASAP